jgi:hypothetical protein
VRDYNDVLAQPAPRRRRVPEVAAEPDLVVETADGAFCGAVVEIGKAVDSGEKRDTVTLEDRNGKRRVFPMLPASFLLEGQPVTLVRPASTAPAKAARAKTASGSYVVADAKARVARASRIWVEGIHDAALVETVWGHDLRVEGIVVEPMHGMDELADAVREFGPAPHRRLGVLVDHLVDGTKEMRAAQAVAGPDVLVTGHPYVDVWEAVKPTCVGIRAWPQIPRGTDWKTGVCAALRWGEPADGARRVLGAVRSYRDLETPLIGAVEQLIDFVTQEG